MMLETFKSIDARMGILEEGRKNIKAEMVAMRTHVIASENRDEQPLFPAEAGRKQVGPD